MKNKIRHRRHNSAQPTSLVGVEMTARVERIIPGGYGLAHADGMTLLIALAAPQDVVRVRVESVRGQTAFASITDFIEPSPVRTSPPCPYFGVCGGCDFQHLAYPAQLDAKRAIVKDCLRRIARIDDLEIEITPAPRPFNYRTRVEWQVDVDKKVLGYYARGSHRICDVETCPVAEEKINARLLEARRHLTALDRTTRELRAVADDDKTVVIASHQTHLESSDVIAQSETLIDETATGDVMPNQSTGIETPDAYAPSRQLERRIGNETYLYDAACFFQINCDVLPLMIDEALRGSERVSPHHALDLYCGVGLFTLPLARQFRQVTGVEAHPLSARYATVNVQNANLTHAHIVNRDVAAWLATNAEKLHRQVSFALLDPPRGGAGSTVIESLIAVRPAHIAYVSCDPATLARDLRLLSERNFRLQSLRLFDMFPQTHHVEIVAHIVAA